MVNFGWFWLGRYVVSSKSYISWHHQVIARKVRRSCDLRKYLSKLATKITRYSPIGHLTMMLWCNICLPITHELSVTLFTKLWNWWNKDRFVRKSVKSWYFWIELKSRGIYMKLPLKKKKTLIWSPRTYLPFPYKIFMWYFNKHQQVLHTHIVLQINSQ